MLDKGKELSPSEIEVCAQAAHEVNRAWSMGLGDKTHKPWHQESPENQLIVRNAVVGIVTYGHDAKQSHESWSALRQAAGWTYSKEKNIEKKEHNGLVPFGDLPPEIRIKDELFVGTVRNIANGFWRIPT